MEFRIQNGNSSLPCVNERGRCNMHLHRSLEPEATVSGPFQCIVSHRTNMLTARARARSVVAKLLKVVYLRVFCIRSTTPLLRR